MYSNLPIGTPNPALFVLLVDQSDSMADPYADSQKATFAALAVNRCIYEILSACRSGEQVKDRCHLTVIGYGASTELLLGGRASELPQKALRQENYKRKELDGAGGLIEIEQTLPIWVEPRHGNGTPMEDGFELALELVEAWIRDNPNNFPPIVFNITDGKPNDLNKTRQAAEHLTKLATKDGAVLIGNCHIGEKGGAEIKLPSSAASLTEPEAQLLFEISSVIPQSLFAAAQAAGLTPQTGSRFFVMNAAADTFVKLLVFGSTHMR